MRHLIPLAATSCVAFLDIVYFNLSTTQSCHPPCSRCSQNFNTNFPIVATLREALIMPPLDNFYHLNSTLSSALSPAKQERIALACLMT